MLKSSSRAAMRLVSDRSMIARARQVAAKMSRLRMRCLTRDVARRHRQIAQLYDRRRDEVSLDEVERIVI
jgi:hypothetical protein